MPARRRSSGTWLHSAVARVRYRRPAIFAIAAADHHASAGPPSGVRPAAYPARNASCSAAANPGGEAPRTSAQERYARALPASRAASARLTVSRSSSDRWPPSTSTCPARNAPCDSTGSVSSGARSARRSKSAASDRPTAGSAWHVDGISVVQLGQLILRAPRDLTLRRSGVDLGEQLPQPPGVPEPLGLGADGSRRTADRTCPGAARWTTAPRSGHSATTSGTGAAAPRRCAEAARVDAAVGVAVGTVGEQLRVEPRASPTGDDVVGHDGPAGGPVADGRDPAAPHGRPAGSRQPGAHLRRVQRRPEARQVPVVRRSAHRRPGRCDLVGHQGGRHRVMADLVDHAAPAPGRPLHRADAAVVRGSRPGWVRRERDREPGQRRVHGRCHAVERGRARHRHDSSAGVGRCIRPACWIGTRRVMPAGSRRRERS